MVISVCGTGSNVTGVTYDRRSLIVNGQRQLFFSGSIHYPRSTPEMWPDLVKNAKKGGLNVIQTYVFWNAHEPRPRQYNFEGRYDLVRFVKLIQEHNMYATLRIGPFIQAEWNHGGLPYWLREVPNITFRTDNEPFKYYMKRFATKIVQMMKKEKLFASQGGPIILSQIENEYKTVAPVFREAGTRYIQWAAKMALGLRTGVPWILCKQEDAPGSVIPTCNGLNCGDTYDGPKGGKKPFLWTENWTARFRIFGDAPSQRPVHDLAFSVARFFSKGGTLANYYMYHGGTNFGRTGASFVLTQYYDEAPLDEYGLRREPNWGHLRYLHYALRLCRNELLWGSSSIQSLGENLEARIYEMKENNTCVAFLANLDIKRDATVNFRGFNYFLQRHSISILPDCKSVAFNTRRVLAQQSARSYHTANETYNINNKWQMYQESVPNFERTSLHANELLELYNMTKDTTDYLWYTTRFTLQGEEWAVLHISSLGHALHAFVNGIYIGTGHGSKMQKMFEFEKTIQLIPGLNHISLLGLMVGLPDSGAYLERRSAGIHKISIQGLDGGAVMDLSSNGWGYEVGLFGEKEIFTDNGGNYVKWTRARSRIPITWYKRYFDAPQENDPIALDLSAMGKGLAWVNGECIGRYWVSYLSPLGEPSQSLYHVPRALLKPKANLLVLFEEHDGNPQNILITTVDRNNICTFVSGQRNPTIKDAKPIALLKCPDEMVVEEIVFASFGNPEGFCGNFTIGSCHAPNAKIIAEQLCSGKSFCKLPVSAKAYGADASCPGTTGTVAVQAKCSKIINL
ncbi:beta-galactosidase 11-like isoform X1 [Carex littledalei]|uniref:Beta-galactosidase n=1 Tax=Carex littledalei TaxID=544730 RepID=A0A833VX00_9POAL|nr:beta-galactosidase 11-like isoform X1 [Carex littledalei]